MQKGFSLIIILVGVAVLAAAGFGVYYFQKQQAIKNINSFEECAKAGYPVTAMFPATCRTPDGRIFTQILSEEEKKKLQPPESTSSTDETSNWKTYTDKNYNFTFKYPDSFESDCCNVGIYLSKETESIEDIITVADPSTIVRRNTDAPFNGLAFKVDPNPNKISFSQYIEMQKKNIPMGVSCNDSEYKDEELSVTIDGKQGVLLRGYCTTAAILVVPFPDDQKMLIILESKISDDFVTLFKEIISSFKFLE